MRLGIVGHEEAKFNEETKAKAKEAIRGSILAHSPSLVLSGECHLGGIDIWAHEAADELGIPFLPCPPENLRWEPKGYKARNLRIANESDHVLCVVVRELPESYTGMRFPSCYHCGDRNPPHIKSGGCWTAWRCKGGYEWVII